jgi:hypothetical protein
VDCEECLEFQPVCNPDNGDLRVEISEMIPLCCEPPESMTLDQTFINVCPQSFDPDPDPDQVFCPPFPQGLPIRPFDVGWLCAEPSTVAFYADLGISVSVGEWVFDLKIRDQNYDQTTGSIFFVYTVSHPCGIGGYSFVGEYGGDFPCGMEPPSVTVSYA